MSRAKTTPPDTTPDQAQAVVTAAEAESSEERRGGREAWSPSVLPPIGVELTDEQKLACTLRVLAREGFSEHIAGHITWQRPGDENLLVNPWGLLWEEVSASDICTVSMDAEVVDGRWDVTPAIHIHTELHRRRPDARVVIHNHPYYVTLMAALGELPSIAHQTGSLLADEIVMVDEYDGEIDTAEMGAVLADRIGSANFALLVSHGIIVVGPTIEEAFMRASVVDRACRLAYDVMAVGREPLPIGPEITRPMKASLIERGSEVIFAGAVRRLIKDEPDVLS